MPRPGRFTPVKDPVPIVWEAGWVPQPAWTNHTAVLVLVLLAAVSSSSLISNGMIQRHTIECDGKVVMNDDEISCRRYWQISARDCLIVDLLGRN